jgi:hypothetical protein
MVNKPDGLALALAIQHKHPKEEAGRGSGDTHSIK